MPANEFYDSTGTPSTGAAGSSADIRAEFDAIEAGFNKMPVLTGNSQEFVTVNTGATALESINAATAKVRLGLNQVDNTADADKPISDLTQTALNGKEDALGNPSQDGMSLKSTTLGVRSWGFTGGPLAIQVFTSSGTYTPTTGATTAVVEVVGGGGGGAGCISGQYGSSGSAGGYAKKRVSLSGVTTETVIIGAAGTGGTGAADGTAGATSSFGAHCSATGGGKGKYNAAADQGGTGVGGDLNIRGGQGGTQNSADSILGNGGALDSATPTFYAATGYGGSGRGATGASTYNGSAGSAGIVIVTEY